MKGILYWITGLSGAGKTTLGNMLYQYLKNTKSNVVLIDGDTIRDVFGNDLGYSEEERFRGAMRNARLSRLLTEQGIDVVFCTISMFDEVRSWNRKYIENYMEIFLDVPIDILQKRDKKNLYQNIREGRTSNVVGMDLHLQLPKSPDIRIVNDENIGPEETFEILIKQINMVKNT